MSITGYGCGGGGGGSNTAGDGVADISDLFTLGTPMPLGLSADMAGGCDRDPNLSADGLDLYLTSGGPGDSPEAMFSGGSHLWVARRATLDDPFGGPENLGPTVNTGAFESGPSISADGLTLFFEVFDGTDCDLYVAQSDTLDDPFGSRENLGPTINSGTCDEDPSISADGLRLFFRSGPGGSSNIWVTTRATTDDPFGAPLPIGLSGVQPDISSDGMELFYVGDTCELWRVDVFPVQ